MMPRFVHVKIDKSVICILIQDYDKMLIRAEQECWRINLPLRFITIIYLHSLCNCSRSCESVTVASSSLYFYNNAKRLYPTLLTFDNKDSFKNYF